jgi:hypothetical protein
MIKIVISLLFAFTFVFAGKYDFIIKEYDVGEFKKACLDGSKKIYSIKDEELLSLIGDACIRVDYINPLGDVIKGLISTKDFRENASYFATILLQKKLLYQFMNDDIDISKLRLPRTSYILSVVFENITKGNYKLLNKSPKKIEISLPNKRYIVWLKPAKLTKVYIGEYEDDKLTKEHWYR